MKVMTHTYTYTTLFIHAKLNTISNNRFSSIDVAFELLFLFCLLSYVKSIWIHGIYAHYYFIN